MYFSQYIGIELLTSACVLCLSLSEVFTMWHVCIFPLFWCFRFENIIREYYRYMIILIQLHRMSSIKVKNKNCLYWVFAENLHFWSDCYIDGNAVMQCSLFSYYIRVFVYLIANLIILLSVLTNGQWWLDYRTRLFVFPRNYTQFGMFRCTLFFSLAIQRMLYAHNVVVSL